jgi:phage terminase large subunit-like protein
VADSDEAEDVVFEALWTRVLSAWDEDKPHQAILEYALRSERLPDLAGRYRALKEDPEKGARAKERIDALVNAATQMMLAMKTPPRTKPPMSITLTAFAIAAFVMAVLAWAVFGRR